MTQSTKQLPIKALKVPATYMRGGTSKGVFFNLNDLPACAQQVGPARDKLLLRVLGSPDPYAKQIDGMGGATSSTTKAVIVSPSASKDHDVDYLFGQVSIDKPFVDWSGNCGNLSSAVGPFAIHQGMIPQDKIPENGTLEIKIWQANIQRSISSKVRIVDGEVQEYGEFELDGVTFPAAEVALEFFESAGEQALFPTGNVVDDLDVPGIGQFKVTMINAGIPTIFLEAEALGYRGTELQTDVNADADALAKLERIRAEGALEMGLIKELSEAETRQHTPKIAWVNRAQTYTSSSGKEVTENEIDLLVRAMSMGQLHHAMMGTAAVAIGIASAVPGTLVNVAAGGGERSRVKFGHPSGTLTVGGKAECIDGEWQAISATMSRSARVIMEGRVVVPADCMK